MKNKKNLILIMIIIGLVLTNVGTVAYYMRTISGTIKGNTGAFTFDVLHNGNTITNNEADKVYIGALIQYEKRDEDSSGGET